ncbi:MULTISPECIES: oligopeptide/dipeptide ABC transporter ATP-binding protein [Halomicrobium]|uniref:Oligopeptide/dipeptide ABC transporter, ATPase subunit n=2 Tax=Halomicrobium mukohataei TaxID=57705 RepID=C7P290_HALMD|nr:MULTISPECIES: oligopeptide/dipeptide ABC transporter ATP-binding protein [Halomicrobium]ACV47319.1 oligopeptide/dipeptide ABC transporter, ATPase subunit [Halomicrobium mukohataei DSM 12286]QCD65788.1 ATP-binding cassette domain-containing protein [Halomicrobium mukohataei]QFR20593.1 ATP-binding cassette domain-containing protein [Halomicrobium sp. ZPS1]
MPGDEVVLTLEDVEVHFENKSSLLDFGGESETVRAVDGVSLDIYERDVIALVGESGCGKTTLGKTSIGLQRPTGGSVKYRGEDIWDIRDGKVDTDTEWADIRQSLQIIHQDPGASLNPNRRLVSILSEPLRQVNPNLSKQEKRERIYALLERVGMTPAADFAERYPHQLSGGEQQRVALCRALLMNPDVILADEAISALDVSLRVEMMDLMLDLQEEFDTSYVFISHDLSNARYFTAHSGGRIGVMYLGQIAEIGPAEAMIQDPHHPYTNVLRWATPDLSLQDAGEVPMRKIDIPDPIDPPKGCNFQTRCPEAREACRQADPQTYHAENQRVRCFREDEDHEYWESPELTD